MNDENDLENMYPTYKAVRLPPQVQEEKPGMGKGGKQFTEHEPRHFSLWLERQRWFWYRELNWVDVVIIVAFYMIGFPFVFGMFAGDDPTPEAMAIVGAMLTSLLLFWTVVPLEYVVLRWYARRGVQVLALIGIVCIIVSYRWIFINTKTPVILLIGMGIFAVVTVLYNIFWRQHRMTRGKSKA